MNQSGLCTNFAVARQFENVSRVLAIREAISQLNSAQISRHDVDAHLEVSLTTRESASLFTCLQMNGASKQVSSDGIGFADYTFEIEPEIGIQVLTQQAAVLAATPDPTTADESETSFVATLPRGFEPKSSRVRSLPAIKNTIRNQVFNATHSVRIANPYFDPSIELIDDLASLPQRGIETRVLTRETNDPRKETGPSLNKMWNQIEPDNRNLFEVRDLYRWNANAGNQSFATHAKIVVVDDTVCYIGSANLTDTSLTTNFEFGVVVEGTQVSDAVTVFDEIFGYARPVDFPIRKV